MIVAGEASADLYGAGLVQALHKQAPNIKCWGVGGHQMVAKGFHAVVRAEKISIAGLTEVLWALPRLWLMLRRLARQVKQQRPQVIVLIDLPDFNLRLAKRLRSLNIPIVYYVSPQIWAWRQKRVNTIAKLVNQMLCILPFEKTFYDKHGVRAQFVGHPLIGRLPRHPDPTQAKIELGFQHDDAPVIALLPGSRKKEVQRHLPVMLAALQRLKLRHPSLVGVIPVANTIERSVIEKYVGHHRESIKILDGQSTQALSACNAAVVCSGTATLQTALLGRPMVIIYKVSWLSYKVLKRLVQVDFIGLVNLISGRGIVPELIQDAITPQAIEQELHGFLSDPVRRLRLTQDYDAVRLALDRGDTAKQVASIVLDYFPTQQSPSSKRPGTLSSVRAK